MQYCMATRRMRPRISKKRQVTVPSRLRKRFHIEAGKSIESEESDGGILIRPVCDIVDSAGALSKYGTAEETIRDLLESRKKAFR